MTATRSVVLVVALVAAVVMVAGCGSKVTKSNYDKITNGMTAEEVQSILGKGTEEAGIGGAIGSIAGSAKVMTWVDGDKKITVTFADNKVTLKAQQGL